MTQVFNSNLIAATIADAAFGLSSRLAATGVVSDEDRFSAAVIEREETMTTWLGHGVALPHARTDFARALGLAVGRSPGGIAWPDARQSARLVVLVAVPPPAVAEYLALVRTIMKGVSDSALRRRMLAATSDDELRSAWEAALR